MKLLQNRLHRDLSRPGHERVALAAGRQDWLVWLALVVGIAGFASGAIDNPAALVSMWREETWVWLATLAVAATLAAAAQRFSGRSMHAAVVIGLAALLPAFGLPAVATVTLILITGYAVGASLLHWVHPNLHVAIRENTFGTTVAGLAVCSLVLGVMTHWPINTPVAYSTLSAIAVVAGRRHIRDACTAFAARKSKDESSDGPPFLLLVLLWFAFGLHAYYSALPERYSDALAMHLVIPRALEQFGYWHFDAREYVWAVQPMGGNWLFGWAYVLAGEYAAKLINAVFLFLVCGLMLEARAVSRTLGYLAVTMLVLTPLAVVESASLFVDNALTLFVVAAIVFASRTQESREFSTAGLALCLAAAVAVKLHAVLAAASITFAVLLFGGWRAALALGGWRMRLLCGVAAAAASLPYLYAWYATGNPTFPFFNAIFKSPLYPPENFENMLYPGGLAVTDFFDFTFSSSKYLESYDGAGGFVIPLLLPVGLLVALVRGSTKLKVIGVVALCYTVLLLLNTRYLRYLFPVFPLLMLVLVSPLALLQQPYARPAIALAALVGIAFSIVRIPSGGWILSRFDLPIAFSPRAKEALLNAEVAARKLGRIQAALGDDHSRVVIFGQSVGADIRGRPIYASWYYWKLLALVYATTSVEGASNALAGLGATHVIFDNNNPQPEWKPWHDATEKYGRLVAKSGNGELYEFNAYAVPGVDLFDSEQMWQGWEIEPSLGHALAGNNLLLPPAAAASKSADVSRLPRAARVTLSASQSCAQSGAIRVQMNWLRSDGSIIRSDATRFTCGDSPANASVTASKPEGAVVAYFYFINDGSADVRLSDERASALPTL